MASNPTGGRNSGSRLTSGRLPSLRPIRDLTLGGGTTTVNTPAAPKPTASNGEAKSSPASASSTPAPATKPKFAPNLAAAGKRQAPVASTTLRTESSPDGKSRGGAANSRGARGGNRGRGRGRGGGFSRHEPEIIQSKGIFSEGLSAETGQPNKIRPWSDGGDVGGGGASGSHFAKRLCDKKAGPKSEAVQTDEEALKNLLRDNFLAEVGREAGCRKPVSLPMSSKNITGPPMGATMGDVDLKPDLMDLEQMVAKTRFSTDTKLDPVLQSLPSAFREIFAPSEIVNKDSNDVPTYFFVQLPNIVADMLSPGGATQNTGAEEVVKSEPMEIDGVEVLQQAHATSDNRVTGINIPSLQQNQRKRQYRHALDNVPEGSIGKLQLLKSGRVRLKLNAPDGESRTFALDASLGSKTSFLQQAVSIQLKDHRSGEDERNGGDLHVLGDVRHRLLFTPKTDELLTNFKASR